MSLKNSIKSFYTKQLHKTLLKDRVIARSDMQSVFPSYTYSDPSDISRVSGNYRYTGVKRPFFLDQFPSTHHFQAPFYSVIEETYLCGRYATGVTCDNKILLETACGSRGYLIKGGGAGLILNSRYFDCEIVIEYAISLVNILSRAYYHWVSEVLPTLQAFFVFMDHHKIRPKIIVDFPLLQFQKEYLALLGIQENDLIFWKFKKAKIKHLIVPSLFYDLIPVDDYWAYHLYAKTGFDWLRKQLQVTSKKAIHTKIFIDRSDASVRRIVNNDQVAQYLHDWGYQSVRLSELTIRDQIDLFYSATHVAGLHGAGFVNTIFSNNLSVYEFYPVGRRFLDPYYFFQVSSYYNHVHHLLGVPAINDSHDVDLDPDYLSNCVLS